ncbi:vascular-related unknown protein 4 isoform X1 [Manihot esculenta]|uniref:Uncharacterized protein n=1 Tax=Manihot esculenta TaxID=3983 RepID=A0A2C9UE31_MANES|nr:vascular-related unknown protein 4 isoform X1 [Manihot esculenta]OAY28544.1 hypothetical protein MANES_15G075000v8 [Manihot esculenta]
MEDSVNSMRELVSSSSNERSCFVGDDYDDDEGGGGGGGHSFHEDSGWTTYLEDFFAKNNNNKQSNDINGENNCCLSYDNEATASLVSDAASLVMKKNDSVDYNDNNSEQEAAAAVGSRFSYSRLSFKKRKTKGALVGDDALEDTASSPVNSPKLNKNTTQRENLGISSPSLQDKGRGSTRQMEDKSEDLGFIGRESDSTELKKRGLCLVPLSMVVNYFG